MKLHFRVLVVALATAVGGSVVAPGTAVADLGLEVLERPDSKESIGEIIEIKVPDGATDAVRTVYLRQAGDKELANVVMTADVDGHAATIGPPGATTTTPVTVPPDGQIVPVTIRVADPGRNEHSGSLDAVAGGKGQYLGKVQTSRRPDAVLAFAGADATGLTDKSDTGAFSRTLEIVSSKNQRVDDLRIKVGPFQDPTGAEVEPTVTVGGEPLADKSYEVQGLGSLEVTIAAPLAVAGDHQTSISLTYADVRAVTVLKVTRTRVAPTVDLTDPGTFAQSADDDATFELEVHENAGRQVLLPQPSLLVKRKEDADSAFTVESGQVTVTSTEPGPPLQLQPSATKTLKIAVPGVDGPGEFTARVRFGGEGAPKEATATLLRRSSWLLAAVILLSALAIGEVLRYFWATYAVRLRSQLTLARVKDELDRVVRQVGLGEGDGEVVRVLRARLWTAYQTLEGNARADVSTDREAVRIRLDPLGRWLALRAKARKAQAGEVIWAKLSTAAAYLRFQTTDAAAAEAALNEAASNLDRAPVLRAELDALALAVEQWEASGRAGPPPDAAATIRQEIERARVALDKADIAEADAARTAAWRGWLTAAAEELARLADIAARPPGTPDPAWTQFVLGAPTELAAIRASQDPAAAYARYVGLSSAYVALAAAGILETLSPKVRKHEAARTAAAAAMSSAQNHDLTTAWERYLTAKRLASEAVGGAAGEAAFGDTGAPDDALAPVPPASAPEAAPTGQEPDEPDARIPSGDAIGADLGRLEWAVTAVAWILAAVSGLLLVYVPDHAWGGVGDALLLFGWGLGVHQIANVTGLGGVRGVLDRLAGTTPPAQ